jgi:hypothetical protein
MQVHDAACLLLFSVLLSCRALKRCNGVRQETSHSFSLSCLTTSSRWRTTAWWRAVRFLGQVGPL